MQESQNTAVVDEDRRWEKGIVPYVVSEEYCKSWFCAPESAHNYSNPQVYRNVKTLPKPKCTLQVKTTERRIAIPFAWSALHKAHLSVETR